MARRHTSGFEILGFASDPTPGDPDRLIDDVVATYESVGTDATDAAALLTGAEVEAGRGEAMEALRKTIGEDYPKKLRTTGESYQGAAAAYRSYAESLQHAQEDIDKAMDKADPVAALADTPSPRPVEEATPVEQRASDDEAAAIRRAQETLSGAKALAADAKALRDGAATTLASELEHVSVVPERSTWEKFLEFFRNIPILQIILGIAIAVLSVFFPVIGMVIGAAFFGLMTAFNTLATGEFDVGAFVVGILTLGFGGAMAAVRNIASITTQVGKISGVVGNFFTRTTGSLGASIKELAARFPNVIVAMKTFTETVGSGLVINFIGAGINKEHYDKDIPVVAIFAGALAGGAVAGGGAGTISRYGTGGGRGLFNPPPKPAGPSPRPAPGTTPGTPPPRAVPLEQAPATPPPPPAPVRAGPIVTTPGTSSGRSEDSWQNAANAGVSGTSTAADGGAKIVAGVTGADESAPGEEDTSPGEAGADEGAGAQAGLGAGSLGNIRKGK